MHPSRQWCHPISTRTPKLAFFYAWPLRLLFVYLFSLFVSVCEWSSLTVVETFSLSLSINTAAIKCNQHDLCAGRTSVQYASQMSSQCYQAFKCLLWSEVRWGAPIYSGSDLILQSLTIIEHIKVSTIQPITLQNESSYRTCAADGSTVANLFAALCCMNWVRSWSYHVLFSSLLGWRCWSCCGTAGVLLMAAYLTCLPKMMQSIDNFTQNLMITLGMSLRSPWAWH